MNNPLWRRRWSTRRKRLTIFVEIVALIVIGYGCLSLANHISADGVSCMNSAPTDIARTSGECVGVTDGSFIFPFASKQLQSLENLIASENRVGGNKNYVTVVYLQPAPNSENDNDTAETLQAFTDQLTGAYAEQRAYNTQVLHQPGPQSFIHLLIASSGVNADQYREVDGIIKADEAADHVVAVAGLDVSLQGTVAEAHELAEGDGIPVFGSTVSSDDFDNIRNMVRISASNKQEIDALLNYFKPAVKKGFLIADTNPADRYSSNVGQEFLSRLGIANLVADQTYSTAPGQFNPSRISDAAQSICNDQPDAVLFGGRGRDLGTLVGDLATGTCLQDHITILTGNNAITIDYAHNPEIPSGLKRNVRVIYAGAFSPAAWEKPINTMEGKDKFTQAAQGYRTYAAALRPVSAVNADNNANVALSYDAMLTATTVIRQAYKGPGLTPSGLLSYLTAFQADNPIYGASGPIVLSGIYNGSSRQGTNPVGKMVPILEFNPDGTSTLLGLEQATVISPGS